MSCCTAGKVPIRGPQSTPGRSGIAPQVGQALQRAFQRGLEIRAADIHDMQERKDGIYVQLTRRETDDRVNDLVRFDRIYCGLGLANDFKFIQDHSPLWENIIEKNSFTSPHRFGGVMADPNGRLPVGGRERRCRVLVHRPPARRPRSPPTGKTTRANNSDIPTFLFDFPIPTMFPDQAAVSCKRSKRRFRPGCNVRASRSRGAPRSRSVRSQRCARSRRSSRPSLRGEVPLRTPRRRCRRASRGAT